MCRNLGGKMSYFHSSRLLFAIKQYKTQFLHIYWKQKKFFLHPLSPHKIRVSEKPTLPIVPEWGKTGTIAPFIYSTKYDKIFNICTS